MALATRRASFRPEQLVSRPSSRPGLVLERRAHQPSRTARERVHFLTTGRGLPCGLPLIREAKMVAAATGLPRPTSGSRQTRPPRVANSIAQGGDVETRPAEGGARVASARCPLARGRSVDSAWRRRRTSRRGSAAHLFLPPQTIIEACARADRHSLTASESFPQV